MLKYVNSRFHFVNRFKKQWNSDEKVEVFYKY